MSFPSLGVSAELAGALAAGGITTPTPIQAQALADALAGRDVCGRARTGSGKTLAFAIPLVQRCAPGARPRAPRGLVAVPTRELAAQVHAVIAPLAAARSLRSRVCYGGTRLEDDVRALADGVELLVVTPGRAIDLVQRRALSLADVATVVVDEADRMADMGFVSQLEWLLRQVTGPHQTMLFSATLDGTVRGLVRDYLRDPTFHEVGGAAAPTDRMVHRFLAVHEMDKARVAAAIQAGSARTLLFVRTKRAADRLHRDLLGLGVRAVAMHGDVPQRGRERALADFAGGKVGALVATDVVGRGIHVEGIDTVVHYDLPADHKEYLHRSGRTARAGATGVAVSLLLWNEHDRARTLMRHLGFSEPVVEVFSNDPRLADLRAWDPARSAA